MEINKLSDVFGVRSKLVKSYIERLEVDNAFKEAITDGNEIVVYGSSKQGKTSLILNNLERDQYVKVECSPQTNRIDIYKSILRQMEITFVESSTTTDSKESGGKINGSGGIRIPFIADAKAGGELSDKQSSTTAIKENFIGYDLNLAQDVSEILRKFKINKFLVLENFHYLTLEVQEQLSYDLRVFQDEGIIFIILGIWREVNRLSQFNGDLVDRITEIAVEPWKKQDFERVIQKGEELLNVDFSQVKDELINSCFDSVGVVQEVCKNCCIDAGVLETSNTKVIITPKNLEEAIRRKSEEYGTRHIRSFESFSIVKRKTSNQSGKLALAFPYYFIKVLLSQEFLSLENGLSNTELLEKIRSVHHRNREDIRSSDLATFLNNITKHQLDSNIKPPFVDYDRSGKRMRIIDSTLYFFFKHCDKQDILDQLPDPFE
ncbi:hypothetical protein [Acinetobacter sp. GSS19]|uniref:hypothetical protein n=1 Tax=Acinetobacter sp. GSS19 TaxID=3020716 RepID=UPI00235DEF45|nr:hypothetical protein [Acinetobacter sp. GSS19]